LTNTALTLAGAGHKTIILDCDFRKPRVHKIFEISNKSGITEMLLSEKTHHDFIHKKVVPNLDVMTAGNVPSNPSEILNSKAMKAFIETVKDEYDYVFIDAPPVLPVTDAVILSTYIDRVILVCAAGGVTFGMAKHAKDALERVGGQILGVVLNKISVKENSQYYYYYYGEKKDQK
jgi:capsular exopolysaccharide synthesis family protein